MLQRGQISVGVAIPPDFERRRLDGREAVQVLVDGSDTVVQSAAIQLARMPLMIIALSMVTIVWTVFQQLYIKPEAEVLIATEVTVGMVSFLLMNVVLMSGRVYAAWQDSGKDSE